MGEFGSTNAGITFFFPLLHAVMQSIAGNENLNSKTQQDGKNMYSELLKKKNS